MPKETATEQLSSKLEKMKKLLSTREASEILGCSSRYLARLARLVKEGRIKPYAKLGNGYLVFEPTEVERYEFPDLHKARKSL